MMTFDKLCGLGYISKLRRMRLEWLVSWNSTASSEEPFHVSPLLLLRCFALGPAPEVKPTGLFERCQARYFGKNPSGMRT
ncbi:unnamed protein product [Tuber melanosporum]|uniref:(Perigord truffle) hypothetical protein n=1 Tax=Tuber melanosporum (strain Mel28) TaxID=656061 RepID=D5G7K1_TUBMM|nr:uncharacterized protein GSTUM_00002642001 [Tuber melanosporum]CAZ80494.1 unnamed protein product [Tuber melanosporum]